MVAIVMALCCVAPGASAQLRTDVYVSGLSLPIAFVQDPLNASVQYVVEQRGRIRVVVNGVISATDFLNLSTHVSGGSEQGLLGLAFAPNYASSGRFYVNFTDGSGNTVIARFRRSAANPLIADAGTRFNLVWPGGTPYIAQPAANHNGGSLAFGPDGYLYLGLGDGGGGNDPAHNAQSPSTLLGKMLRIDVNVPDSDTEGYDIPPGNPFVAGLPVAARHEIWAFGLRNPWKYSFDDPARGGTGALLIADVGQGSWEEIDYEPPDRGGRNYGWRNREGFHSNVTSLPPAYLPLVNPILEYDHGVGCSVTGGYVYRGTALGSSYVGRYFFGDFCAGRVWSVALAISGTTGEATSSNLIEHTSELGGSSSIGLISSFGVDAHGELYILSYGSGRVLRISPPRATLTTGISFPASAGTPITWTATASSGIPPLQYQFWRLKQGVGWVLGQDYSSNNTYTWTPGSSDTGTYLLQVWVRSDGSTAPYDTWGSTPFFTILRPPPLTITSFGANRTFPAAPGVPITWTALTSGGNPPLEYQFWRLKQGVGWTLVQGYNALNTYTWTPTAADAGTYVLQVWVRSVGSSALYDTWSGTGNFVITGPAPLRITNFSSNVALPVTAGTPITWSASATGGTPPVQFRFYLLDVGAGAWTLLRDYSPLSSVTWTPPAAGMYVVQVWARSATSVAPYDDWRWTGYFSILP